MTSRAGDTLPVAEIFSPGPPPVLSSDDFVWYLHRGGRRVGPAHPGGRMLDPEATGPPSVRIRVSGSHPDLQRDRPAGPQL